jgi:hypothetical protein
LLRYVSSAGTIIVTDPHYSQAVHIQFADQVCRISLHAAMLLGHRIEPVYRPQNMLDHCVAFIRADSRPSHRAI